MRTGKSLTVSVVIGSYNRLSFLRRTIDSVRSELKDVSHEIVVVDGGSDDGTLKWLVTQKDLIVIVQHNRGVWRGRALPRRSWGYFMNLGFRCAAADYVCMLSDDCLVVPGAITSGIETFDQERRAGKGVGAVAFYWRNWPEDEHYRVGFTFGDRMFVNHGLYLKEALDEIGYADEGTYQFYHADGDVCLRMRERGYLTVDSSTSFIEHFARANEPIRRENLKRQKEDWAAYVKRWGHLGAPTAEWREKRFLDLSGTAKRYWWWHGVKHSGASAMNGVFGHVRAGRLGALARRGRRTLERVAWRRK